MIIQNAGRGDRLRRLPVTGNETVLDVIGQVDGLSQIESKNICIVRPTAGEPHGTIMPVDWEAISRHGATATNYQIHAGDRVYIGDEPITK